MSAKPLVYTVWITLSVLFFGLRPATASVVVFSEDFSSYTGWNSGDNRMNTAWTSVVNTPALLAGTGEWPSAYLRLNNSTVYTSLETPITGSFSLTVTTLAGSYGRFNWFGLTDSTGSNGYYIGWDGSTSGQYLGQGRVGIGKITSAVSSFSNPGAISSYITSGHTASGNSTVEFATVSLTYIAESSTLKL